MNNLFDRYGEMLLTCTLQHILYTVISVAIGFGIGFFLGVVFSRYKGLSKVMFPLLSTFQTIPGVVFLGIMFHFTGMKPITAITALSIYAIFPVLKNTYSGIVNVEEQYCEAGRGCGMNNWQILFKIEIPLASSSIFAGLRLSTIYTVSWAVLGAMIGVGGLGEFVYRGIGSNDSTLILLGAVPCAILAVLMGKLIDLAQDKMTPRGLKSKI